MKQNMKGKEMEKIIIEHKTGKIREGPGKLTDAQIDLLSDLLVNAILEEQETAAEQKIA